MAYDQEYLNYIKEIILDEKGRAITNILENIGWFNLPEKTVFNLFHEYETILDIETKYEIIREIFMNDTDVIDYMMSRDYLTRTLTIHKTEFSNTIARRLSIGKNKSSALINNFVLRDLFHTIPTQSKGVCIQPTDITEKEKEQLTKRIESRFNYLFESSVDTIDFNSENLYKEEE